MANPRDSRQSPGVQRRTCQAEQVASSTARSIVRIRTTREKISDTRPEITKPTREEQEKKMAEGKTLELRAMDNVERPQVDVEKTERDRSLRGKKRVKAARAKRRAERRG